MFSLFSKKKAPSAFDFSILKVDMHSHMLPGIDDGAKELAHSIEMIRALQALGYQKIITTPHIFWDLYRNTPDIINRQLDIVRKALQDNGIDIELEAAAEYFLDEHMAQMVQKKEPLLTVKGNMVLTEFSTMHLSLGMKETLFDLMMAGYQPILAHPERYAYLSQNREIFHDLKENGCLFQLNILSLTGGYGKTVMEMAEYFIKNDFYSYLGTDTHHTGHIERLRDPRLAGPLKALVSSGKILNAELW